MVLDLARAVRVSGTGIAGSGVNWTVMLIAGVVTMVLAAVCAAVAVVVLFNGHLLSATTFDLLVWAAISWLAVRAVRTGDDRLWLVAGVVLGVGLLNKPGARCTGPRARRRSARHAHPPESAVAELVAAGLSNREIATKLVVTHRTVERHVSRIYAELGINSRSALAAAVERGRG